MDGIVVTTSSSPSLSQSDAILKPPLSVSLLIRTEKERTTRGGPVYLHHSCSTCDTYSPSQRTQPVSVTTRALIPVTIVNPLGNYDLHYCNIQYFSPVIPTSCPKDMDEMGDQMEG